MGNELLMFRVYDTIEKKYVEQCVALFLGMDGKVYTFDGKKYVSDENGRYLVERCTGLRDCKKNPIFENDLLRMSNVRNMPAIEVVVKWKRGAWWLEFDDASDDTMDSFVQEGAVFEVIGNIHEH